MSAPCFAISTATTAPIRLPPVTSATRFERFIQTLYCRSFDMAFEWDVCTFFQSLYSNRAQEKRMLKRAFGVAVVISPLATAPALAQAQAPAAPTPTPAPTTEAPAAQAP